MYLIFYQKSHTMSFAAEELEIEINEPEIGEIEAGAIEVN